jgi:hypothetical protein
MARKGAIKHKLGFGSGVLLEHDDGTVSYVKPGGFTPAFTVRIADVTGFVVRKGDKKLERTLALLGHGTELLTAEVGVGIGEKVEAWFRAHPAFGTTAAVVTQAPGNAPVPSLADELGKLAALREQGILTDEEFAAQKAKLLG